MCQSSSRADCWLVAAVACASGRPHWMLTNSCRRCVTASVDDGMRAFGSWAGDCQVAARASRLQALHVAAARDARGLLYVSGVCGTVVKAPVVWVPCDLILSSGLCRSVKQLGAAASRPFRV
jgi:hypothetical protein